MSKRKVKNYTEEFTRSSAKLAVDLDQSISKTAIERSGVFCRTSLVKYAWINKHQKEFSIKTMCSALGVNRSRYYDWVTSQKNPSARALENKELSEKIKMIFIENKC